MLKGLLFFVISLYVGFNLLVFFRYSTKDMCRELIDDQNAVGRIAGNLFYLPAWVLKIITHYVKKDFRKLWKGIKYCYYAVVMFFKQIYHSIFDLI